MKKIKTYQRILNSATSLFAEQGYDGAIMDDLAKQCDVNKASIYYHHKDKATLYENVLTALFIPIADAVIKAVEAEKDVVQKLEVHIKTFAKANAKNPEFAAILMREMASGGVNLPMRAREQMQRILATLRKILELGETQGVFKTADFLIIHFMIIGTINLFVASIPLRKTLATTDEYSPLKNTDIEFASKQLAETIIGSLLIEEKS